MHMVILKGTLLRNFYKNRGHFFSRGRRNLQISALERKIFVLSNSMSFMVFWNFLTSLATFEVVNFIFLEIWMRFFFQKKIEKMKIFNFFLYVCAMVSEGTKCLCTIKYMFLRYFFIKQNIFWQFLFFHDSQWSWLTSFFITKKMIFSCKKNFKGWKLFCFYL